MARRPADRGLTVIASSYGEQALESEPRALMIRRVLMREARDTGDRVAAVAALNADRED
jgi:hypothetical protein